MKTPRALTLMALALIAGGCENGPTLPEVGTEFGPDAEVQAAAALDQGAAQALAMVEESLGQLPDGVLADGRPDRARTDSIQRRDPTDRVRPNDRRPDDRRPDRDRRAKLAVALGAEAVALAERLLEGTDPSPGQLRHLEHAQQLQRRAEAAFDEGRHTAAAELAHGAQIAALKAVVLPEGVSEQEARAIHDLAADLLERARRAVAADPSEVKRHLLGLAERLFEKGSAQIAGGSMRGVVALWKSAALSSFLIG